MASSSGSTAVRGNEPCNHTPQLTAVAPPPCSNSESHKRSRDEDDNIAAESNAGSLRIKRKKRVQQPASNLEPCPKIGQPFAGLSSNFVLESPKSDPIVAYENTVANLSVGTATCETEIPISFLSKEPPSSYEALEDRLL